MLTRMGLPGPVGCVLHLTSPHPAERIWYHRYEQLGNHKIRANVTLGTCQHQPCHPSSTGSAQLSVLVPLHTAVRMAARETFSSTLPKLHPSADDSTYCKAHVYSRPGDSVDTNM